MTEKKFSEPKDAPSEATRRVAPLRISTCGLCPATDPGQVVVESLLFIEVQEMDTYTLVCTPEDTQALAAGFAFSEGMISSRDDILMLSRCRDDPGVIRLRLADPSQARKSHRNLLVVSSCGICGSGTEKNQEDLIDSAPRVDDCLRIPGGWFPSAMQSMRTQQRIFTETGGTHAAAVFSPNGNLVAFAEDIGRHNAMDKAIGKCLLASLPTSGCAIALSGRVSFELVAKSARAGIELIAAVSAPSSLAIDLADRCNITLCGFVREDRATVYTHRRRILEFE